MANALLGVLENWRDDSSRKRLGRLYCSLVGRVNRAIRTAKEVRATQDELTALEGAHGEWAGHDKRLPASMSVLLLSVVAVYGIDYTLFTPTTEYIGRSTFRAGSWGMDAAKLFIPAAIVMLEIYIGTQLYLVLKDGLGDLRWMKFAGWTAFGLVMVAAMPTAVVATNMSRQHALDLPSTATVAPGFWRLDSAHSWQTLSLVALAFVAHAGVIFAGKTALESKAYVLFATRRRRLKARLRSQQASLPGVETAAAEGFREYATAIESHNRRFANPLAAGPFPQPVTSWVNSHFGDEVIRPAAGARTVPVAPDLDESAAPDPAESGEVEYLRAALEERIREAESELKP